MQEKENNITNLVAKDTACEDETLHDTTVECHMVG